VISLTRPAASLTLLPASPHARRVPPPQMTPLRVLLADDHAVVRQALQALLERHGFEVVAEVSDGGAAVTAARLLRPDVAVLDVAMPILNGVDAAHEIALVAPATRVILLSALDDSYFVPAALRAGVRGFVLKVQGIDDLVHAIQDVSQGRLYVSAGVSQAVVDAVATARDTEDGTGRGDGAPRLSVRERQVVQLVAEGKSTKQIAGLLKISVKTAEFHRGRLMDKLDIHDTAGLVRYAIRQGLVQP
jgi:two-component system, NarL family, response regulator LiaR